MYSHDAEFRESGEGWAHKPAATKDPRNCPDCDGSGTHNGAEIPVECRTCWGSGAARPTTGEPR